MRSERLAIVRAFALALVAFASLASLPTRAQTADQLKLFQSMPKEQRDAILQQLGIGRGGSGAGGISSPDNQITVDRAPGAADGGAAGEALPASADRPIRGEEQLLIELTLPEDIDQAALAQIVAAQRPANATAATSPPTVVRPPQRTAEERRRLEERRDRVLKRNPYELDREGVLQLPGFAPIRLTGLTTGEVQERLSMDPGLREFQVGVTILRVTPAGLRGLKPFGYDMLKRGANAFVPGTDIPTPSDYRLDAGDVLDIQLYGQTSETYTLPVSREGTINLPDLGPIAVGGMTFGGARNAVEGRVRQQMIGTQARVTLSELRSVRVLLLGDAERPGSYVVSGLSTVTNALFAGGGVKAIGTLRAVEVKRAGKLVRKLDLYDVLLRGDTRNDVRLQSGDVVFVPPVGRTAGIDGQVRRPAIYELVGERNAGELVELAGGLTPEADARLVTVERTGTGTGGARSVVTVDLSTAEGRAFPLLSGDTLRVATIRPVVDNGIVLEGHVVRPGLFEYRPGLRLADVLGSADDLSPRADLNYVLIRRESARDQRVSVFSADLAAALASPSSPANIELAPRDQITVFDLETNRDRIVEPLLAELRRQGRPGSAARVIYVGGRVNVPGTYPLEEGMTVADLIRAGGGMQDGAYMGSAELTRYEVDASGEQRRTIVNNVDLAAALRGEVGSDVALQPYDVLTIKQTPEWSRVEEIGLYGEVRFPGRYPLRPGETLNSVLERAGGLTTKAFAEGALFTREDLKQREREQIDQLALRLQSDIAVLSLQASQTNPAAGQSVAVGQGLLEQLRSAQPVGRLVIDLTAITDGADGKDVVLRNGDRLYVPRVTQEVSVLGEVQSATSHLLSRRLSRDDAVALSGGFTQKADKKRVYVVRANGTVIGSSSGWFKQAGDIALRPGDTVVVPIDAQRMRPLPMWTAVTTIIFNLAVAVAAIAGI